MFRMREGLKLAGLGRGPSVFASTSVRLRRDRALRRDKFAKRFSPQGFFQNLRQKLRLRQKTFRLQAARFAGCLNRGKIDVGGEVLLADVGQKIVAGVMAKIGAERASVRLGENISSAVKP